MKTIRMFFRGGYLAYRGLFNWTSLGVYVPTMLVGPILQLVFFTYLGRAVGLADDAFFSVGNAVQVSAFGGLYVSVLVVANERQFDTLSSVLASAASRFAVFFGRSLAAIANGVLVSAVAFGAAVPLMGFRIPPAALPGLAATVVVAAVAGTMFGLALGAIAMRLNDIWLICNIAYVVTLLLCGVNVPLQALPWWMEAIGRALPLTHGIEAARELLAGAPFADVADLIGREALTGAAYGVLAYLLIRLFEVENRHRATLNTL